MNIKYIIPIMCAALLSCETAAEYKIRLSEMPDTELFSYCIFSTHKDVLLDEMVERKLIRKKEAPYVKQEAIFVGMSEKAVRCSLGYPPKINKTASALGVQYQWVYECLHGSGDFTYRVPCKYVHIRNGKVTSYQFLDD